MTEYMVKFDLITGENFKGWYSSDAIEEVVDWVTEDLEEHGGGHADIYDENDNFIDDLEI